MLIDNRLPTFLGELRAGAEVDCAAVVADMTLAEGEHHAAAEARGEYADIEAIEPIWSMQDGVLTITLTNGDEVDLQMDRETEH